MIFELLKNFHANFKKLYLERAVAGTHNRRLAKKRVQCLNEVLCFVSRLVLIDNFALRNPLLRQAPNRWQIYYEKTTKDNNPTIFSSNMFWTKSKHN